MSIYKDPRSSLKVQPTALHVWMSSALHIVMHVCMSIYTSSLGLCRVWEPRLDPLSIYSVLVLIASRPCHQLHGLADEPGKLTHLIQSILLIDLFLPISVFLFSIHLFQCLGDMLETDPSPTIWPNPQYCLAHDHTQYMVYPYQVEQLAS